MEIPGIVVSGALVTGATVISAFVFNQGYAWLRDAISGWIKLPELGTTAKKAVVAGVALGLTGYSSLALLPAGSAPEELLAYATIVFKASQELYDRIWVALLKAK